MSEFVSVYFLHGPWGFILWGIWMALILFLGPKIGTKPDWDDDDIFKGYDVDTDPENLASIMYGMNDDKWKD